MSSLSEKSLRGKILYALSETEERTVSCLIALIGHYISPEKAIRNYEIRMKNLGRDTRGLYQKKVERGRRNYIIQELSHLLRLGKVEKTGRYSTAKWKRVPNIKENTGDDK